MLAVFPRTLSHGISGAFSSSGAAAGAGARALEDDLDLHLAINPIYSEGSAPSTATLNGRQSGASGSQGQGFARGSAVQAAGTHESLYTVGMVGVLGLLKFWSCM